MKKVTHSLTEGKSKHFNASQPYTFAHSTLFYYQRVHCPSMESTLDKGHIKFLEEYLMKYDKKSKSKNDSYTIPQHG